jgi:peroxiredoxin
MRPFRTLLPLAAAATAFACIALVAQDQGQEGHDHDAAKAPKVGEEAKNFKAETVAGKEIELQESFKGKVVLLDFWATWCPPCRKEIPHLKKAYDSLHDKGLEIVGISLDDGRVELDAVKAFTSKHEMKWPQVYGDASRTIAEAYMVEYIPTTYLIDGDTGKVLGTKENLRGEELEATIKKHMDEKAKAAKSDKGKGQKSRP